MEVAFYPGGRESSVIVGYIFEKELRFDTKNRSNC